ncbi:MAG: phospholipase D-like domain-containing protein [Rhabdochlamydiaceae bacterium]|jgi:phosphatidylserine/phosphatidylglycerophosphate/cardiolipin synthase-like enzyme
MQRLILLILLFFVPIQASQNITVYFSPDDHLEKQLIKMIDQENKSIHVCIYTFTDREVADALVAAKKRGVDVEVIVDRFSVKAKSPLHRLSAAMIPVYVWDPGRGREKRARRPLMHNKFCIFGGHSVWTGSFNFTYDASRSHQENALVVRDEGVAHAYQNQFASIKMRSCIPIASFVAEKPKKRLNKR